jgi:hypothetical protein
MEDPFDKELILQMFCSMLFSNRITQYERQTIVEGFLKLFLSSRLKSSKCISIITNEFWKETENTEIKRCIQAILPFLIHVGKTTKNCFEKSIFHSLKIYIYERSKYVASIDPTNQFKYLINLAEGKNDPIKIKQEKLIKEEKDLNLSSSLNNISVVSSTNNTNVDLSNNSMVVNHLPGTPLHNLIAFQICSQVQIDPQGIFSSLCHILPLLKLDPTQESIFEKIKNKAQTLTEVKHFFIFIRF